MVVIYIYVLHTGYYLEYRRRHKVLPHFVINQICPSFRAAIALWTPQLVHPGESGGSRADLFYLTAQISRQHGWSRQTDMLDKPVKPLKEFKLAHMRRSRASEASDR